jgi:hypothetical protein
MSNKFKIKKKKELSEEDKDLAKKEKKEKKQQQTFAKTGSKSNFNNVAGKSSKDFSRKKV